MARDAKLALPPVAGARPLFTVLALLSCGVLGWLFSLPRAELPDRPLPNFRDNPMMQLPQRVPAIAPLYSAAEAEYNVGRMLNFSKERWDVPTAAVGTYLVLVAAGPQVMASRPACDFRLSLATWNWVLSLFSFVGAVRTVPHLLYNLASGPFRDTICVSPELDWGVGSTGIWVQLFIYSKIPELLDTVFIVLHRKPLTFLHWYHHVTVLLYCWHSYATECGAGLYFIAMNYTVHAVMYAYFALAALRLLPRWFPTPLVTAMQISQMFVGMFICASSWYYVAWDPRPCFNDQTNLVLGGAMYLSYFWLFIVFAVRRYCVRPAQRRRKDD